MSKKTFSIVFPIVCILVSGCTQTRYSVMPQMHDAGNVPVTTQHRWKLVAINDSSSSRRDTLVEYLNRYLYGIAIGDVRKCMQNAYPDVFAEDGIPFEIRIHDAVRESDNSIGAYLVTIGILPATKKEDGRTTFSLEFGDECDVRSAFVIRTVCEEALAAYSPFHFWCYDTPYDSGTMRNFGYYDRWYIHSGHYERDKAGFRCQALAYAVAMKLKEVEADSAKIAAVLKANQKKSLYRIVKCERDAGSEVAYSFTVELSEQAQGSLQLFGQIRQEICDSIKENHLATFSGLDRNAVVVDITTYGQRAGMIEGKAVVMQVALVSLFYDANMRTGRLSVRFHATQHQQARDWIRNNIATLARDKNIALVTGKIPPDARFYLGREELKEGNVLEIEFKTE